MSDVKTISIIGCGNMGEALIAGILRSKLFPAEKVMGMDNSPARLKYIKEKYSVNTTKDITLAVKNSDIIIIAVKPAIVEKALSGMSGCLTKEKLLISVAAGITTAFIEKITGGEIPVIRVMPNTPALLCLGASGICRGKYADEFDERTASEILQSVGIVVSTTEDKLDAITALSGSGPAYVFYFIESMISAGIKAGLNEEDARKLTLQTIMGSVYMAYETEDSPKTLRKKVTSPGGTTEAAIKVLAENNFQKILVEAILKAKERSKELGKIK